MRLLKIFSKEFLAEFKILICAETLIILTIPSTRTRGMAAVAVPARVVYDFEGQADNNELTVYEHELITVVCEVIHS